MSFRWGAFDIKEMVGGKIVITSFGGATGHGKRAHGAGAAHVRTPGTSVDWPLREAD